MCIYVLTGGAAGSVARITGSLGSALAAMSLDKNYKMVYINDYVMRVFSSLEIKGTQIESDIS